MRRIIQFESIKYMIKIMFPHFSPSENHPTLATHFCTSNLVCTANDLRYHRWEWLCFWSNQGSILLFQCLSMHVQPFVPLERINKIPKSHPTLSNPPPRLHQHLSVSGMLLDMHIREILLWSQSHALLQCAALPRRRIVDETSLTFRDQWCYCYWSFWLGVIIGAAGCWRWWCRCFGFDCRVRVREALVAKDSFMFHVLLPSVASTPVNQGWCWWWFEEVWGLGAIKVQCAIDRR